jgi:hypothetical protein
MHVRHFSAVRAHFWPGFISHLISDFARKGHHTMKKHKKVLGGCLCVCMGSLLVRTMKRTETREWHSTPPHRPVSSLDGHCVCCCNFVGGEVQQL